MGKTTKKKHIKNKLITNNSKNEISDKSDSSHESKHKNTFLTSKNTNKLIYKGGKYIRPYNQINEINKSHKINDNLIQKKNKNTHTNRNIGTLNALKKYGYINNIQKGGFIIDYIKIKYKLHQVKNFIVKFRKEEKNIQKYIDSYNGTTASFKELAEKKATEITKYIIDFKQKSIFQFIIQNADNEKTLKTSDLEDNITLIDSRLKGIENSIQSFNKSKNKTIPEFIKYNKIFQKDSKKFLNLIDYFETKLRGFFREIETIRSEYLKYQGKTKIDDASKKKVKKYQRFSADIDYMLSFKDTDIKKMVDLKQEISTILDTGKDYTKKYELIEKENYIEDLEQWRENYSSIYENFKELDDKIDDFIKFF